MTNDVRLYPDSDPSESVWLLLNVLRVPGSVPLLSLLDLEGLPGARVSPCASAAMERVKLIAGERVGCDAALEEFVQELGLEGQAASRLNIYAQTQFDTQGRQGLGRSAVVGVLTVLWHVAWKQGAVPTELGSRFGELRDVLRAEVPKDRWRANFESFEDGLQAVDAGQLEAGLLPVPQLIARRGTERAWRATVDLLSPSELSDLKVWAGVNSESIGVRLWRHGNVLPSLEDEIYMLPLGWEL